MKNKNNENFMDTNSDKLILSMVTLIYSLILVLQFGLYAY